MLGMYSVNGPGWSVSGITILASHGYGHYDQLIAVDTTTIDANTNQDNHAPSSSNGGSGAGKVTKVSTAGSLRPLPLPDILSSGPCAAPPPSSTSASSSTGAVGGPTVVPGGFNMASDLALAQWLCLGNGVAAQAKGGDGVAHVPGGALFVAPTTGKLSFKDTKGVVHALY